MKPFLILVVSTFLFACSDKKDEANAEPQKNSTDMYKTPSKPNRAADKGF